MTTAAGLIGRAALALVVAASSTGCFAVANLDRFHAADDADAAGGSSSTGSTGSTVETDYQRFQFEVIGFAPHKGHLFEYRIIDANNFIQSRGMVNPLGATDFTLVAPKAIPPTNGPYRLDFYVDVDNTSSYDGIGDTKTQDHAWRVDPLEDYPPGSPHNPGIIDVQYTHNLQFTDINVVVELPRPPTDTGVDASLAFTGMGDHMGQLLEARITEADTGHVVGLYRIPALSEADFTVTVPGVIDPGVVYVVDIYVDANANGTYDSPAGQGGDLGFRLLNQASDATGLHVTFDPTKETNSSVDVGPP